MKSNIVLIGMAASGKSTTGVVLAKTINKNFVDTDLYIQQRTGKTLQDILNQDGIEVFKEIIFKAYGVKSQDGRRFIKSKELSEEFSQTEAFSELFIELALDEKAAADFFNGIMPANM